jgi:hypothetical protein
VAKAGTLHFTKKPKQFLIVTKARNAGSWQIAKPDSAPFYAGVDRVAECRQEREWKKSRRLTEGAALNANDSPHPGLADVKFH